MERSLNVHTTKKNNFLKMLVGITRKTSADEGRKKNLNQSKNKFICVFVFLADGYIFSEKEELISGHFAFRVNVSS